MNKKMKMRINRLLHPLIINILEALHKNSYKIVSIRELHVPETPTIFAFTHISANDVTLANEVVSQPAHALMASDPLSKSQMLLSMLMGMVPVDRTDKTKRSQRKAMEEMLELLKLGSHIIIFPEAVWNLTANSLVLPLHWGTVELAQKSGCCIIPVAIFRTDNGDYYINAGDAMQIDGNEDKAGATESLYSILCDLTGQMVFDENIQKSIPRDRFDPAQEVARRLRPEMGMVWNPESEYRFIQRKTSHPVEARITQ